MKHPKAPQVAALEALVGSPKKAAAYDSQVTLNGFEFNFKKKSATKVYPVLEIVKQEKGKEGIEDMKKK